MTTLMRPKLLFVAMLLATVVLAACGGDESDQPPETPTPATVPTATAGLPAPTPTAQPASAIPTVQPGSAPPQAIDTSDWLTYTSPLGFTMQYPPTWLSRDLSASGGAVFSNERAQQVTTREDQSGVASIEILPDAYPRFNPDELFRVCGLRGDEDQLSSPGFSVEASVVTFAGLPAVRCVQETIHAFSGLPVKGILVFVGLPSGRAMLFASSAQNSDTGTLALLEVILTTVSFDAGAMVE